MNLVNKKMGLEDHEYELYVNLLLAFCLRFYSAWEKHCLKYTVWYETCYQWPLDVDTYGCRLSIM